FNTDLGPLDLLGWVEPFGPYENLLPHVEAISVGVGALQTIGLDDLIVIKRRIGPAASGPVDAEEQPHLCFLPVTDLGLAFRGREALAPFPPFSRVWRDGAKRGSDAPPLPPPRLPWTAPAACPAPRRTSTAFRRWDWGCCRSPGDSGPVDRSGSASTLPPES